MTRELGTYSSCQFPNIMPSSQIQCHLDAIYDTKLRITKLGTSFGLIAEQVCPSVSAFGGTVTRSSINNEPAGELVRCTYRVGPGRHLSRCNED
jgi:hypothetical protein